MSGRDTTDKEGMLGRLVLVSSDSRARMLLGNYLEGLGYEVNVATDLSELLGMVEQCPPDLVLDQRIDGGENTASLALKEASIDLPVVVLDSKTRAKRRATRTTTAAVLPWPSPRTVVAEAVAQALLDRRASARSASRAAEQSEENEPATVDRIGRYRVEALIGRGGMGSVYRCFDETFRRVVAIKTIRSEEHLSSDGRDMNIERFQVEAGALARLVHPRIVATYDFGVDHKRMEMFLVMQFISGPSLHHRLKEGPLPIAEAVRIGWDLADALAHAHERGVVHRDIKPDNVLLNDLGQPMLTDFGLARLGNFSVSGFNTVAGTINYMAPEQILCPKEIDARTDQYGLGAVIHQMLTRAFSGSITMSPASVLRSLTAQRQPLAELGVEAPASLQALLTRMLEREASDRFPDDEALLEALHAVGDELGLMLERAL